MTSPPTLTPDQEDALREVANIMIGNATIALSRLTDARIDMDIPRIRIVSWERGLEEVMEGRDLLAGIRTRILGELSGEAYLTFDRDSALTLADILRDLPRGHTRYMSTASASAIVEVGNIVVGACLSALYRFVDVPLVHSVPEFLYDRPDALALSKPPAARQDPILLAKVALEAQGVDLRGDLVLLFTLESLTSLLKILESPP